MFSKSQIILQVTATVILGLLLFLTTNLLSKLLKGNPIPTIIRYNIPSDDPDDIFSGKKSVKLLKKNFKFITYAFTGDSSEDDKIFESFKAEAGRLKYTNDTTHLVRIYLHENITYGRFLKILTLMKEDGFKRYLEWDNFFYVVGEKYLKYKTGL
jgi:hypothetical protein